MQPLTMDFQKHKIEHLIIALKAQHGPEATESDVAALEYRLGLQFPLAYKEFLMTLGNVDFGDGILGNASDSLPSVANETEFLRNTQPNTFPMNVLAICPDGAGNYWCLVCHGRDQGNVIFWQHDASAALRYPHFPANDPEFWISSTNFWGWLLDYLRLAEEALGDWLNQSTR